jgi:hypothetical protein
VQRPPDRTGRQQKMIVTAKLTQKIIKSLKSINSREEIISDTQKYLEYRRIEKQDSLYSYVDPDISYRYAYCAAGY